MGWLDFLEKWSHADAWAELEHRLSSSWNAWDQWQKTLIVLSVALFLLGSLLIGRWALWSSHQLNVEPVESVAVDADKAAWRLAEAIRLKTISHQDPAKFDGNAFLELHEFLATSYPKVHTTLKRETVSDYSLLYRWQGSKSGLKPLLFLAHMDVVPVTPGTELNWEQPAFTGVIDDGFIWGRGSLDDKDSVLALLEALEILIAQGYQPERTLYLAFGHDEEIGGYEGAAKIAKLLDERGERFMMSLDEGTAITEGIIKGLSKPGAVVGVSEKGYLTLRLTARGKGGHASAPPPHTALGLIARAIYRLEDDPFPAEIRAPVSDMMDYLAPEMDFLTGVKYANRWLFSGSIERGMLKSPGNSAKLRTTFAATMARAGVKDNILPDTARAIVNIRIMPGETVDGTITRVEKVIDDPLIKIENLTAFEPAPVSDLNSDSFRIIHQTIAEIFPDVVVTPGLVGGSTDSKHYAYLADHTYRFKPVRITPDDYGRVHGTNERISVDVYAGMIGFYARLIENLAGRGEAPAPEMTEDDIEAIDAAAIEAAAEAAKIAEQKRKEQAVKKKRAADEAKRKAAAKKAAEKKAKAKAKAKPKVKPVAKPKPVPEAKTESPEKPAESEKPAETKEESTEKVEPEAKTDSEPAAKTEAEPVEKKDTEPKSEPEKAEPAKVPEPAN